MRCLFCKEDSQSSRSVEHILPESIGNVSHTLPQGVVCDGCNNYFARKVEKPFLECPPIALLRFEQAVPSKRGRVPSCNGILLPSAPAVLTRAPHGKPGMAMEVSEPAIRQILRAGKGTIIVPASGDGLPDGPVLSRFLAKAALEAMALRLVERSGGIEYLVDHAGLYALRDHARRGATLLWPVSVRRIYDANRVWSTESGELYQVAHEFDILKTDSDEWFFILALFGLELAMNFGGPEIAGYKRWLEEKSGASPLYSGKNATA